ncbi:hypothetical protein [Ornithinimicrobium avium]|uniref:hypothetical protein n=1 Tax=Ornithinimicrobium avium TaxID=2283195 RepID=UPI0013B44CD1|nr:hypothetical protein [Ornithinimicrobium avium]
MSGVLETLVAGSFLVAVYAIILGRAKRIGTVGGSGRIGSLGLPDSRTADMTLGLLATAQLTLLVGQELGGRDGAAIGLVGGMTLGYSRVRTLLSVVGVLAGLAGAAAFVLGPGLEGAVVWRLFFVSTVILCFVLGMGLGQVFLGRSHRFFTFGKGRGLAFFGLVEVFTFFGSPVGADLLGLEPRRFGGYFVVALLGAVGLGAVMGPMTLWLLAGTLGLVTVTFGDPRLSGFLVSGLVVFLIVWAVLGRRLGWWER